LIDDDSDDDEGEKDVKVDPLEDGKYTISDIANAMGMHKEEKTMSRIMNELRKSHKDIESSAVRDGRVFQYKYYLRSHQKPVVKQEVTSSSRRSRQNRFEEEEKEEKSGIQQIDTTTYQNTVLQMLKSPS
jgi:hypothetical protein